MHGTALGGSGMARRAVSIVCRVRDKGSFECPRSAWSFSGGITSVPYGATER